MRKTSFEVAAVVATVVVVVDVVDFVEVAAVVVAVARPCVLIQKSSVGAIRFWFFAVRRKASATSRFPETPQDREICFSR